MGRTSNVRQRLIEVAIELLWEQSYRSVSVDQICARAEVQKGSFYHFFPSKCGLACAAYEHEWQQRQRFLDATFNADLPPLVRLQNYCQEILERQQAKCAATGKVCGCPFAAAAAEMSTQDECIRSTIQDLFDRGIRIFESTLREAQDQAVIATDWDPAHQARSIHSLVLGMLIQAKVRNDPTVLEDLWPAMRALIGASQTSAAISHPIS